MFFRKFKNDFIRILEIRFPKILNLVLVSTIISFHINCFFTTKTYTNAFPYSKDVRVPNTEIEKIEIDSNNLIKVQIKDHTQCIKINSGSYYIHYRLNFPNYGCGKFNQSDSSIGTLSYQEISNSAILDNDKIILDFSSLPEDKFYLRNPGVAWGLYNPKSYGYVPDPAIDTPFINAYITSDYKYVFVKKKGKTYVFNTIDDKGLLRRIEKRDRDDEESIESKENKILRAYKTKLLPLKLIRINGIGILSIKEYKSKRLYYKLNNTENLYEIYLALSKEVPQDTNYKYIPLLPFSLLADILVSPVVVPVLTFYGTVYLFR
ncbi:hypothetical protein AB3N60_01835 [Leptospira sp. WS39.C2]